jgi:hypothetical protein
MAFSYSRRTVRPAGCTPRTNGVIVGKQKDRRELFVPWVNDGEFSEQVRRRGDPDYGQPGYLGLDVRPRLPDQPRER